MIIFDSFCDKKDKFSENDFQSLLERVKNNDLSITGLDIRGTLNPEQFTSLFEVLKKNNTVEALVLRGNDFKCDLSNKDIYLGLSSLLQTSQNIKALTLYHTNIKDDGIEYITSAL